MPAEKKRGRGQPRKYMPDELMQKWNDFMLYCAENEKLPTQEGFAIYAGINPDTFYSYMSMDDYSDTKKNIEAQLLDKTVQEAFKSRNPAFLIFYLKNKFGWKDKQEIDTNTSGSIEVVFSSDLEKWSK